NKPEEADGSAGRGFDHRVNCAAKVRNVSRPGSQDKPERQQSFWLRQTYFNVYKWTNLRRPRLSQGRSHAGVLGSGLRGREARTDESSCPRFSRWQQEKPSKGVFMAEVVLLRH